MMELYFPIEVFVGFGSDRLNRHLLMRRPAERSGLIGPRLVIVKEQLYAYCRGLMRQQIPSMKVLSSTPKIRSL